MTAVPRVSTQPAVTSSGGGKTGLSTYLAIVAVLAGLALIAGLAGLYFTRDRSLPPPAGSDIPPAPEEPPGEPLDGGRYSPPQPDVDHDWGSQTPGPPPPPPGSGSEPGPGPDEG